MMGPGLQAIWDSMSWRRGVGSGAAQDLQQCCAQVWADGTHMKSRLLYTVHMSAVCWQARMRAVHFCPQSGAGFRHAPGELL
jgi:hypothetical protein